MKSIIIPLNYNNNSTLNKITLIANQLQIYSNIELNLILTIYQIFKNTPFKNNSKIHQNLKDDIIQIIQQDVDNKQVVKKEPTLSAINNAIWKLTRSGGLIEVDGYLVLNSCFKDIDQVEQIVFRFN